VIPENNSFCSLPGRDKMEAADMNIDRRRISRYSVKGHAFASNSKTQFGQVIDMSLGGIRFVFVDTGKWPDQKGEMDIFFNENGFGIEEIVCKTKWENVLANSISGMTIKERGVEFFNLNELQKKQLESFLVKENNFPVAASPTNT